jgi:hypothetical protein
MLLMAVRFPQNALGRLQDVRGFLSERKRGACSLGSRETPVKEMKTNSQFSRRGMHDASSLPFEVRLAER